MDASQSPTAPPGASQEATGIFRLPVELRLEIYRFVLDPSESICQEWNEKWRRFYNKPPHPISLLATCRKVNLEATDVFYKVNVFYATAGLDWESQQAPPVIEQKYLPDLALSFIRKLCVVFDGTTLRLNPWLYGFPLCFRQFREMKSLEDLCFCAVFSRQYYLDGADDALTETIRHVRRYVPEACKIRFGARDKGELYYLWEVARYDMNRMSCDEINALHLSMLSNFVSATEPRF